MKLTKLLLLAFALSSTALLAENKSVDLTKGVPDNANGKTVTLSISQGDTLWVQASDYDGKKDNAIEFQFTNPAVLGVSRSGSENDIYPPSTKKIHLHYLSLIPQKVGKTVIKAFFPKVVLAEVGPQPLTNEDTSVTVEVVE